MGRELGKEVGRCLRKGTKRGEREPRAALDGRRAFAIRINLLALPPYQPRYPLRRAAQGLEEGRRWRKKRRRE